VSKTTAIGVEETDSAAETPGEVALPDMSLIPALLGRHRSLIKLRYDFPVVLVAGDSTRQIQSLKSVINDLLQRTAPQGIPGERMRRDLMRLEAEIRRTVADGTRGRLSELWERAARDLLERADKAERELVEDHLRRAREALEVDGELIDCDAETPGRISTHIWRQAESIRARTALNRISQLRLRLGQILEADFINSEEGHAPGHLKAMIGPAYEESFDFSKLSKVLNKALPRSGLPEARRQRIDRTLEVMRTQKFFPTINVVDDSHEFVFKTITEALSAWEERLGEMVELVKAIQIAELEINNRYQESKYDSWFAQFDSSRLGNGDYALFPSYLVIMDEKRFSDAEKARLIEVLSSNKPFNIITRHRNLFAGAKSPNPTESNGWLSQLGPLAASLGTASVVQAASSSMYKVAGDLQEAISWGGPSLVSIYTGKSSNNSGLPPYLTAAVATQSRVFPTFTYLPGVGPEQADRFHVMANPQPESDWPVDRFSWHDNELQVSVVDLPFTPAEFLACDRSWSKYFARIPDSVSEETLCPLPEWLGLDKLARRRKRPFILMVDAENRVIRIMVRDKVLATLPRIQAAWRSLQELGGLGNSHARRLLDRERLIWEDAKQQEIDELRATLGAEPTTAVAPAEAPVAIESTASVETAAAPPSEEPWIETPRCTTCNECTNRNSRMFAYNGNKQAYIKDAAAGTYKDLVEAAEHCQVAIIHPGKPKNPDEAGLGDLVKRAEPFQK
jgi:hypothetical protein